MYGQSYLRIKERSFFLSNEDIFIQVSDNFDFNGITHSHCFIELIYVISGTATHTVESFTFDPLSEEGFVTYDLLFTPDFFNPATKFFYQTFKNMIGITPAEYRREKCAKQEEM